MAETRSSDLWSRSLTLIRPEPEPEPEPDADANADANAEPNPSQALAATLPSIAKKAEPEVAVLLDTVLRAWTDGSLDADDLLPNNLPLKRAYALELACAAPPPPPPQSVVSELSIDLSDVDRAVPQTSKEGVVTRLALDCHVDVRVTLAVPLQARLRGRATLLPDATAQLRRARVRGELRVWWHVQTGVLRAAFVQRPHAELYGLQGGYLRVPACCLGVCSCLVGSVVEPIVAFSLGLLNESQPFAMPFKAPTSIRVAATFNASDKSLASMRGQLVKATKVLRSLANPVIGGKYNPDKGIPRAALRQAKGMVILTTLAGGAVASGMVGSGIVVARLADGSWSPPAGIAAIGGGLGVQLGARNTSTVLILFTEASVRAFMRGSAQLKLGFDLAVAVGPVGRDLNIGARVGAKGITPSFAYSHTSGLYLGSYKAFDVLKHRHAENEEYYRQKDISPADILGGGVPWPDDESGLHALLDELCSSPAAGAAPAAAPAAAPLLPAAAVRAAAGAAALRARTAASAAT